MANDKWNGSNPWLGLAPYTEGTPLYGRTKESVQLADIIKDYMASVVFGKSGIGKSSLLSAGISPLLREEGYIPVRIRLVHNTEVSYSEQIESKVRETVHCIDRLPSDVNNLGLWDFFHRHTFTTENGINCIPVIILDQFEEIYTLTNADHKKDIIIFFNELSSLLNDIKPDIVIEEERKHSAIQNDSGSVTLKQGIIKRFAASALNYTSATSFRFVICLREDKLYLLERNSVNIPSLKANRYNLQALSQNSGLEVIMCPRPELFSNEQATDIIDKLSDMGDEGIRTIDPAILSLFLYKYYEKQGQANYDNIFADYYQEATQAIKGKSIAFLEDHLLTLGGYRNQVPLDDALSSGVSLDEINSLLKSVILRMEKRKGIDYIEFSHDRLCAEAKKCRIERVNKEKTKTVRKRMMLSFLIVAISTAMLSVVLWLAIILDKKNANLIEKNVQLESSWAETTLSNVQYNISNGNLIEAATIIQSILYNLNTREESIRDKALLTLRNLYSSFHSQGQYDKFIAHDGQICDMGFNSDGSLLATTSNDQTIRIWSTANGQLIKELSLTSDIGNIWTSTEVNSFFHDYDKTRPAYNHSIYKTYSSISTGRTVGKCVEQNTPYYTHGNPIVFSPDGIWKLSRNQNKIQVYKNKEIKFAINIGDSVHINHMEFSYDNSRFLIFYNSDILNRYVAEYNIEGTLIRTIDLTNLDYVSTYGCIYLPNTYNMLYIDHKKGPIEILENGDRIPFVDDRRVQVIAVNPKANIMALGTSDGNLILRHYNPVVMCESADSTDQEYFTNELAPYDDGMEIYDRHTRDSFDGLLLQSSMKTAFIIDTINMKTIALKGHQNNIGNAIFDRTHKMVVTRAFDNTIRFWDVRTGVELEHLRIRVSGYGNQSISCSKDNKYIVSSSDDTIYVWEIKTGDIVFAMPCKDVCYSCFSSDGERILFTTGFSNKEKNVQAVKFLTNEKLLDWYYSKMPKRLK